MQIIGGVTLTHDMVVSGESVNSSNKTQIETTIGGSSIITTFNRLSKNIFTLTATDTTGWQTYAVKEALLQLAENGGSFVVNLNGNIFNAVFYGNVEFKKLIDTTLDGSIYDYYTGSFTIVKIP